MGAPIFCKKLLNSIIVLRLTIFTLKKQIFYTGSDKMLTFFISNVCWESTGMIYARIQNTQFISKRLPFITRKIWSFIVFSFEPLHVEIANPRVIQILSLRIARQPFADQCHLRFHDIFSASLSNSALVNPDSLRS